MKLNKHEAELFIPDGIPEEEAVKRTTHMGIAAHQDDLEIMSYDGIVKCFGQRDKWYMGVVVTNGAGSPRDNLYANYTDEDMQKIRKVEQKKAAYVGEYGALALLHYTSSEVKDRSNKESIEEIKSLITIAAPEVIYTHNLADKHDTHIGVATKVIKAIRELPKEQRPKKVYGCEVWRNLDWLMDDEKVLFDVSAHPNISAALVGVFDSQICGGKRYDLACEGRRVANATYAASHGTDQASALSYAMDLTPLIEEDQMDVAEYVTSYIERFKKDVMEKISKHF